MVRIAMVDYSKCKPKNAITNNIRMDGVMILTKDKKIDTIRNF